MPPPPPPLKPALRTGTQAQLCTHVLKNNIQVVVHKINTYAPESKTPYNTEKYQIFCVVTEIEGRLSVSRNHQHNCCGGGGGGLTPLQGLNTHKFITYQCECYKLEKGLELLRFAR